MEGVVVEKGREKNRPYCATDFFLFFLFFLPVLRRFDFSLLIVVVESKYLIFVLLLRFF